MRGKLFDQQNIPNKKIYILLVGAPCTGKSAWRAQMQEALKEQQILNSSLSHDDIVYQLIAEKKESDPACTLTYHELCQSNEYTKIKAERFSQAFDLAKTQKNGVVIIDRTHLSANFRNNVLDQIGRTELVYAVYFEVQDKKAWEKNLSIRSTQTDKIITMDIVNKLSQGASVPLLEEGFTRVITCTVYGERDWNEVFSESIQSIMDDLGIYAGNAPELSAVIR